MQLVIGIISQARSESTLECDDDDNSHEMSAHDYEKYKKSYVEMDDTNKWVLTNGTIVEDALYHFGLRCNYEQYVYINNKLTLFRMHKFRLHFIPL